VRAAFFSTQWSKPISTGLGGIAVTTDPALARELAALERAARVPTLRERGLLAALLLARERLATPRTVRAGRAAYQRAGRAGLVPGSSSRGELEGTLMPPAFATGMSDLQARLGARRLATLGARVRHRRADAERYAGWLAARGATPAHEPARAGHAYLRYPVRVRDPDGLIDAAARRGLLLGDWFRSPIYPIAGDLQRWRYRRGTNPVAERVAAEIVNLPTDLVPDGPEIEAVEAVLASVADRIR
jgi:perosamine synthetase